MSGQNSSGDLERDDSGSLPQAAGALAEQVQHAAQSLLQLGSGRGGETAIALSRLIVAIADEAARNARFANSLRSALSSSAANASAFPRRPNRRAPGIFDPFLIYGEGGEGSLRERLAELDLDQLRDIVAEHGRDNDRLAMKWKDPGRVAERIVERVITRHAKGSAFLSYSGSIWCTYCFPHGRWLLPRDGPDAT